ncbi:MAG: hypothetical protein B5M56_09205 [Desulfococcus sp. 4484_241]|nr:MAG: hypothetical protein B5M56_09205 [Desulfococcus sp. 4484_241]
MNNRVGKTARGKTVPTGHAKWLVAFVLACVVVPILSAVPAMALKTLTDAELTKISGQTGLVIKGGLGVRAEATYAKLDLDSRSAGHYIEIKDGAYYDQPYDTSTSTYRNDSDSIALTIGGGTFDPSSAHTWQPANIYPLHLELDVATVAGTGSGLVLSAPRLDGDLYIKADQILANDSSHTSNFLFGLDLGPISFPNFSDSAAPLGLIIDPGYNSNGAGIKGQLGMKLRIDNIGLNRIKNSGLDRGVGLLFCGDFTDDPNATAFTSNWNADYWENNTATGTWIMGNFATHPISIEAATLSGNTYIIINLTGNYTRTVTYRDLASSNMGTTTVYYDSAGTRHIGDPNNFVVHYVLGEVRLDRVEGHAGGTLRNIGGLSLEDLDMEHTLVVIPTNNNGSAPFVPPNTFRTYGSGSTPPTASNIGNTTQLPSGITWNSTF